MILADTSVWIDHFRRGHGLFAECLEGNRILTHPFVLGELSCGNLSQRATTLEYLGNLERVETADHGEALSFIETHALFSRGLGYIDVHLLAAARLSSVRFWTLDKRLSEVAETLSVAFIP